MKEKYQLQCPPPHDAVTHQMVKSSCSYYGCTAQTGRGRGVRSLHPRVPRNRVELRVEASARATSDGSRAVNSNQFKFFLQEPDALVAAAAAAPTGQVCVPGHHVSTGPQPKPVGVVRLQLPAGTTSFSSSPRGYSGGGRAW